MGTPSHFVSPPPRNGSRTQPENTLLTAKYGGGEVRERAARSEHPFVKGISAATRPVPLPPPLASVPFRDSR